VAPLGVIEYLDVVEDVSACVVARGADLPTDALALEQLEEAFGQIVVAAIAAPAHAADQVVVAQEDLPVMLSELVAWSECTVTASDLLGISETVIPRRRRVAGLDGVAA
jgi:hypothetical protein